MKRIISVILLAIMVVVAGCAGMDAQHQTGTGIGAGLGAVTGALLDHKNPWRGAAIGAAVGGTVGYTVTDVSIRGAQEAAVSGRPVEYKSEDGRGRYYAEPLDYDARTHCRKVRETVWDNGHQVKQQTREVCESKSTRTGY